MDGVQLGDFKECICLHLFPSFLLYLLVFVDPAQSRSMNDISDTPSTDQVSPRSLIPLIPTPLSTALIL